LKELVKVIGIFWGKLNKEGYMERDYSDLLPEFINSAKKLKNY